MSLRLPNYPNQGQKLAFGWDAVPQLKNVTAYLGTDGLAFLPVQDRNGYTNGVERNLGTSGIAYSGVPIVEWTSPWISDGQLKFLLDSNGVSGNVTVAVHTPESVGSEDVSNYNAVLNIDLNQLPNLRRERNGYRDFKWKFALVEVL